MERVNIIDINNGEIKALPKLQALNMIKHNPTRFPALSVDKGTKIQLIDAQKLRAVELSLVDSRYFTAANPDRYIMPGDLDFEDLKGEYLEIAKVAKAFNEGKSVIEVSATEKAQADEIAKLKAQLAAAEAAYEKGQAEKAAPAAKKIVAKKPVAKKKTVAKA